MSRLGSWLRGPTSKAVGGSSRAHTATDESKDLEDALIAATMIMNDDVDGADRKLMESDSAFHQLGRGVTLFMRSLLGFEKDVMKDAQDRLLEAEAVAWASLKRAQKESDGFHSNIYPPGSEYALCHAQAQLMSAVVAVLNENLTESLKGFYKLRKAYLKLDGILAVEEKHMKQAKGINGSSKTSLASDLGNKIIPSGFDDGEPADRSGTNGSTKDDNENLEFVDADEAHSGAQTPANYLGHVELENEVNDVEKKLADLSTSPNTSPEGTESSTSLTARNPGGSSNGVELGDGPDAALFTDPIDIFVHSGSNLCYGLLQLILSMVPPVFSRLLSVIGFRGDKERGLSMLWQSTKFSNINGAVAGLVLLGYYNGLVSFCDILTDPDEFPDDLTGHPKAKCEALLADMRVRYPDSPMWRMEEARMQSGNRQLKAAIETLSSNMGSNMKQILALNMFEKCLASMYYHDYALAAKSYEECMELNSWSHALYTFIIGACHVEMYRDTLASNPDQAKKHKGVAEAKFRIAPTLSGKKKVLTKPLPFDTYVSRKVQKWEERAKEWNVDLIDAIGVSPIEETIYLWNGSKRMGVPELELSLKNLEWSRVTSHQQEHEANKDDIAVRAVLKASVLRNLDRCEEAKRLLEDEVLSHDSSLFKGLLREDWSYPSAIYEMSVLAWAEKDKEGMDTKAKVMECEEHLARVARWEAYILDSRLGLKITTAQDTLKRYKAITGM